MHDAHKDVTIAILIDIRETLVGTKHHVGQSFLVFDHMDVNTHLIEERFYESPLILSFDRIDIAYLISHMRINDIVDRVVQGTNHQHVGR